MAKDPRVTTIEVLIEFRDAAMPDAAVSVQRLNDSGAAAYRGLHRQRREGWSRYAGNALYMPPWWDECGEYGPRTEAALNRATAEYNDNRAGGGLWDRDTERAAHPERSSREAALNAERFDQERMRGFVERHSAQISQRLLEVYQGFYVDRQSKGATARRMGIAKQTVENHLKILRRLMKGHRER